MTRVLSFDRVLEQLELDTAGVGAGPNANAEDQNEQLSILGSQFERV
jgi:hypothetical protein